MTRDRPSVLVTDGVERAALATVRSLGRAGFPVCVAAARPSIAGASRYCVRELIVPDALADPAGFQAAVVAAAERERVAVLVPVSEQALRVLLPVDWRGRGVAIPFPDAATFARAADKREVLAAARTAGIAVPAQHVLTDPAAPLPRDLAWPVVIKPTRSVVAASGGWTRLGVAYADDASSLSARLRHLDAAAFPVLLQQRIVGPGVGVFLLEWDGRRAVFAHRRLREKPPSGGVSVYRESVHADPALVERSAGLLGALGWRGVAMVEYKIDAATGVPYLMEINGRLWGSLQLAIDAGVDFPRLLVDAALGRPPASPPEYRVGVRSRWWWGDVDHLIARLRRTDRELDLPPGTPPRWRVLVDFVTACRPGTRNEVLRFHDPLPFVRETLDWLARR